MAAGAGLKEPRLGLRGVKEQDAGQRRLVWGWSHSCEGAWGTRWWGSSEQWPQRPPACLSWSLFWHLPGPGGQDTIPAMLNAWFRPLGNSSSGSFLSLHKGSCPPISFLKPGCWISAPLSWGGKEQVPL